MANEVVDVEEMGLVHQPKKQEEANRAQVPMEAGKTALDTIYDHYQKKLYVFDRSWSMEEGMAPEDEAAMYIWSPETLNKFRDLIKDEAKLSGAVPAAGIDPDDDEDVEDALGDDADVVEAAGLEDDQELIQYVIKNGLHRRSGMEPPLDHNHLRKTERKIESVRGAMKRFVEKRFKQYPDAQVGMIGFGSAAYIMCYPGAPKPEVELAIDSLRADLGGTDIVVAIKLALNEFKARPSHVGSHHIVMVTDAEAYMEPEQAKNFLHQMKEMNVCFDFIYVKGATQSAYGAFYSPDAPDSMVNMLKKMCKETGGEYAEVSKSSDFEEKFLAASQRKALPPYQGGR